MNIKRILFILFFAILFHAGYPQNIFDTTFVYQPLNDFSRKTAGPDSLSFMLTGNGTKHLTIFSKKYWQSPGYTSISPKAEEYDLNFEGDKYLLTKRWGALPLPEEEIASLVKRRSCYFTLEGHWHSDSVSIRRIYQCPEQSEEMTFVAVPGNIQYKPGKEKLTELFENAATRYNPMQNNNAGDSAYIFQVLVAKDSSVRMIRLIEGAYSSFAQVLMDELKKSGPWIPAQHGGRNISAYTRIFVRLLPHNKLTVDCCY